MRCECQSFSAPPVGSYGESCVAETTKRRREEERKRQRDEEAKGRREEETKGREDENRVTSYSPPIHLLFVSCPLHLPIRSILIQFVSKTVLHQGTPLCESSVKVDVGGKL